LGVALEPGIALLAAWFCIDLQSGQSKAGPSTGNPYCGHRSPMSWQDTLSPHLSQCKNSGLRKDRRVVSSGAARKTWEKSPFVFWLLPCLCNRSSNQSRSTVVPDTPLALFAFLRLQAPNSFDSKRLLPKYTFWPNLK